jgi:hypothetical protein
MGYFKKELIKNSSKNTYLNRTELNESSKINSANSTLNNETISNSDNTTSGRSQNSKSAQGEIKKIIEILHTKKLNEIQRKNSESYNEFINRIKQEKQEFDINIEQLKRTTATTSISSSSTSIMSTETGNNGKNFSSKKSGRGRNATKKPYLKTTESTDNIEGEINEPLDGSNNPTTSGLNKKNSKQKTNIYDHNPITDMFFYNRDTENKTLDEKIMGDDPYVAECYKKFNLKTASIKIDDCFKVGLFKDMKDQTRIKLSESMKKVLKLGPKSYLLAHDNAHALNAQSRSKQPAKKQNYEKKKAIKEECIDHSMLDTSHSENKTVTKQKQLFDFFTRNNVTIKNSDSSETSSVKSNFSVNSSSASLDTTILNEKNQIQKSSGNFEMPQIPASDRTMSIDSTESLDDFNGSDLSSFNQKPIKSSSGNTILCEKSLSSSNSHTNILNKVDHNKSYIPPSHESKENMTLNDSVDSEISRPKSKSKHLKRKTKFNKGCIII